MTSAAFIDAQGQGRHGWLRTMGTLGLIIAGAVVVLIPVRVLVFPWLQANGADMPEPIRSGILALAAGALFAGVLAGLFMGLRWLHRRSVSSVLTTAPRFRLSHALIGFTVTVVLVGGVGILMDPEGIKPLADFDPGIVAFSLVAMLIGFGIQASAEEVLFRGYILQVAQRALRSRWAAAALSIGLFTVAHYGYGVESAVFSLITAVGLTACVLLLNGLEMAMGIHVANNLVVGFLFQDLANANAPSASGFAWDQIAADAAIMVALVGIAFALRRLALRPAAT